MNTTIDYRYADGSNCKVERTWTVTGPCTDEQTAALRATCMQEDDRDFFVPSAVGMPGLAPSDWDEDIDHGMCMLLDVETTDAEADDARTVAEMIAAFAARDWHADEAVLMRMKREDAQCN